jgi:hypothetical protein
MKHLTLRQLQAPDDNDRKFEHATIRQHAELQALIDLHLVLGLLKVLTVEEAVKEIKRLQSYERTFKVLVGNLGGWKE